MKNNVQFNTNHLIYTNCECFFDNIDLLHNLIVKVFSVSKEEHRLEEDKERCRQDCLVKAVEQGWRTTFKDLRTGVSNSNPLEGRMSIKKCSMGHRLMEKGPCGPQSIEEGSEGHMSCQI